MNTVKPFFILLFILASVIITTAQTKGEFIDVRDGTTYKTITYKIMKKKKVYPITWMAENLNFQTKDSFCVNDSISNCKNYGRLYTWFEANEVCPSGWHLPSDEEWNQLADLYGGLKTAGEHLKTKGKNKGSNKSEFNGVSGGMRDASNDTYYKVGTAGFFWSSTESQKNPEEASDWSFASWTDELRHWEGGKLIGNSCRCVKD